MEMYEGGGRGHVVIIFNLQINNPVFSFQKFDRPVLSYSTAVPSWQAIFAMAGTGLLGFLQVKYSGNQRSPFETHPKTTFFALSSFSMYCFSYNFKLVYSTSHRLSAVSRCCVILFGPLFLSSATCLLFPDSLRPVLITKFDRPVLATAKTAVPSWQTVFTMAGTGLLGFLQVKYSGNQRSPFETYPKTTFLALSSFLMYFLSYNVKLVYPASHRLSAVSRFCVILFGPLFLSAVSCLLFPDSLRPVLITLSLSFSLSQMIPESAIQSFWKWLARIWNRGQRNLAINGQRLLHV